mmetsp:Transcript_25109/g.48899  ORF Transcript_25109/g.48899 Transcript_25109/m.48899 type:complete len:223 (-) Transcript_25109:701-1369(-)
MLTKMMMTLGSCPTNTPQAIWLQLSSLQTKMLVAPWLLKYASTPPWGKKFAVVTHRRTKQSPPSTLTHGHPSNSPPELHTLRHLPSSLAAHDPSLQHASSLGEIARLGRTSKHAWGVLLHPGKLYVTHASSSSPHRTLLRPPTVELAPSSEVTHSRGFRHFWLSCPQLQQSRSVAHVCSGALQHSVSRRGRTLREALGSWHRTFSRSSTRLQVEVPSGWSSV